MSIIAGTTIEYEMKKHDEITSAYSYAPYVTAWNTYEYGIAQNPVCKWNYPTQTIHTEAGDTSAYADILWLYDPEYVFPEANILINASENDTLNVITKLDIQQYKFKIKSFRTMYASDTGVSNTINSRTAGYTLQTNENIVDVQYCFYDKDDPDIEIYDIYPVMRYVVNGEIWYFRINILFSNYIRNVPTDSNKLTVQAPDGYFTPHDDEILMFHCPVSSDWTKNFPSLNNAFLCGTNSEYNVVFSNVSNGNNSLYSLAASVETMLHVVATLGIYFEYNGTMYLGFMDETGQTTGEYLTAEDWNKSAQWESENINNFSEHTPPYVPPTPSGDDIDKQHFGGGTTLGGAENLWLLTTAQMTSLHNAISNCDVPNFEPLNSVISVMGLAIPPTYPLGTDIATLITINIRKSDGTLWSTHTEGHICDKQTASFGFTNNIKIKRKYNNFLDYPPYSSHEIFLPLCGWLPLPAYAVGRNLTVYYVHDINTCSVRGLVFCEGSLIGEKYGTMGANIPFSSSGHSLYVGGLITGGVQTLADFATAVSSKGPIALMSAIQGVAEGANTLLASNQNRTSVIGQNQDRTSFADGQYIRIKSTYPDVKIEENFGHTFGFVCNKKGQLKDFKGFTTCENPHVYGFSCTSEEKDEIERLLKAGIIINIPEE